MLKSRIYTIRGLKVMLDADLAEIYGYSTGAFNHQVKNNIERIAEDFRFQLTEEEMRILMCKKCTSSWGGAKKRTYAFTERYRQLRGREAPASQSSRTLCFH